MKIVLSWLENYLTLTPGTSQAALQQALIQLGHEVDSITTSGQTYPNVVIGKVLSREQHPNADKLGVCMVEVGEAQPRQIVCGAPNARAGLTVAVALPGAVLPGNFEIKTSKIRDVESQGMLCSQRELAMGDEHNGIWEIDDTSATPGTLLDSILPAPQTVLDVALTPNRGDCFSHLGLARELAVPRPRHPQAAAGAGPRQRRLHLSGRHQHAVLPQSSTFWKSRISVTPNPQPPSAPSCWLRACGLKTR